MRREVEELTLLEEAVLQELPGTVAESQTRLRRNAWKCGRMEVGEALAYMQRHGYVTWDGQVWKPLEKV